MIAARPYRRRRTATDRRPRWFDIPEDPDPDEAGEDYDRFGMMMKIDTLDRPWRDLINEYGFTLVMKCMMAGQDSSVAAQSLARIRSHRQGSN